MSGYEDEKPLMDSHQEPLNFSGRERIISPLKLWEKVSGGAKLAIHLSLILFYTTFFVYTVAITNASCEVPGNTALYPSSGNTSILFPGLQVH